MTSPQHDPGPCYAERPKGATALLAVRTADGHTVYPTFQFEPAVADALPDILRRFTDAAVDGWALTMWLTTPAAALEAMTPVQWLLQHRPLEPVAALADDTAARWSKEH